MLDPTDYSILGCLKDNARMQWKDIGKEVHMTGQAVSARIEKMSEDGVIRRFTVDLDNEKLGITQSGYIMVSMKTTNHSDFVRFLKESESIIEASRISGKGCYLLKFGVRNQSDLNALLDDILLHANYQLNIIVESIK